MKTSFGLVLMAVAAALPAAETREMTIGQSGQIQINDRPAGHTEKPVYRSSDVEILFVTANGRVSARKAGTATISVQIGAHEEEIEITVVKSEAQIALETKHADETAARYAESDRGYRPVHAEGEPRDRGRFVRGEQDGIGRDNFDADGFDSTGFDRAGLDKNGYDRAGKSHTG